jgi:hypothetical protein
VTEQPLRPAGAAGRAVAGDYVRDVLAVLFLLIPLGMAWDLEIRAIGHDVIVPVTMLSILSLALPYLSTASVLPKGLTATRLRMVRLLVNVPYLVVVLWTLVRAYTEDGSATGVSAGTGVGMGVVYGLVGVMLAAQGRVAELRGGLNDGRLWITVTVVLAGLGVALAAVSAVLFTVEFTTEPSWSEFVVLGLGFVFFAGVPLIAVSGFARGDGAWRDVTVALGVAGLVAALWAQSAEETMGSAWSLRLAGPQILLWPALGAAAAAPGVVRHIVRSPGAGRWFDLSARLFQMVAAVAVIAMLLSGFRIIDNIEDRAEHIAGIVFALIVIVTATFGRAALVKDARTGWPRALGAAGILVLVMIVQTTVTGTARMLSITVDMATILSLWFVFAGAIVVALTAPASVRSQLGPPGSDRPAEQYEVRPTFPADDEPIWKASPEAKDSR